MPPTRVLVVDDSAVVRRIVTSVLDAEPDVEVVGTAADGLNAIAAVSALRPDVMTLDVEMPVVDGLGVLRELRRRGLAVPTVMFSTLTTEGARTTVDALVLGAADVVAKPSGVTDVRVAMAGIAADLLPRVRALGSRRVVAPPRGPRRLPRRPRTGAADVVCIGVSTGGPSALEHLLARLPADLPVPVLVVQHMPATFTALLAQRLDRVCAVHVREASTDVVPGPGEVWLAPSGQHLAVRSSAVGPVLSLTDEPPVVGCRPAADVLFRTAAETYGAATLAVVMTGLGRDGTDGARAVRQAGGSVLVQDEASSTVWGMPGSVVRAGLHDGVVGLDDLAAELVHRTTPAPLAAVAEVG